uniref:Uncharacterized protein n=1 Tax=Rhizobium rhizogenes TaxID=359 RepID=A0A7S4ZRK3_RHIRH|nr:hypothetical protein pC5.7c_520 [Rhizobium rhizogenes]
MISIKPLRSNLLQTTWRYPRDTSRERAEGSRLDLRKHVKLHQCRTLRRHEIQLTAAAAASTPETDFAGDC